MACLREALIFFSRKEQLLNWRRVTQRCRRFWDSAIILQKKKCCPSILILQKIQRQYLSFVEIQGQYLNSAESAGTEPYFCRKFSSNTTILRKVLGYCQYYNSAEHARAVPKFCRKCYASTTLLQKKMLGQYRNSAENARTVPKFCRK